MPDFEPFVVLPAQRGEYRTKPGGGKTPDPLVEVDAQLRSRLSSELREVQQLASSGRPGVSQGIPVAITVRDEALAKTKRPYRLLAEADLTPVAGESRGELISRATPQNTATLANLIETRTTKRDLFAISTFDTFHVWDPIRDAIEAQGAVSASELLDRAREQERPIRIELFPWLSVQSQWEPGRTLAEYLNDIGFPVISTAGPRTRPALYLRVTPDATLESFSGLIGIRTAVIAPSYGTPRLIEQQSFRELNNSLPVTLPAPNGSDALVGVLDSGVEPGALDPWVRRQWRYEVASDLDTTHGTFVAGLVVASRILNSDSDDFPAESAAIFDAQVLPGNTGVSEDILIDRITEVLNEAGPTGPRVWNCSFNNGGDPVDPVTYGTLSAELDLLAATHGILFVQSAGNYAIRSGWPPDGSAGVADVITVPAEGIRSLTVGSLSHLGGMTPRGAVASYSRRGPSFGGQQKPDLTFWSGDISANLQLEGFGVRSVGPGDVEMESVGTSFATPVVASLGANVWQDLESGQAVGDVQPELVKGLLVHSATLANMDIADDHRPYYGAGAPRSDSTALFDRPWTFTTIHEVDLRTGVNWEKRPFPIPECLINSNGKLKAVAAVTIAYSPVIDAAFGGECVRTCVEASFGQYGVKKGEEKFTGKMGGSHDWERQLVERGKWSPIKTYRQCWTKGIEVTGDWALQLRLTARDSAIEPLTQRVYAIVTLEALDESLTVYEDGLRAVAQLRYPNALAVEAGRLRARTQL